MDTPQIYVACLAAYNSGILHGKWINVVPDADEIHAEIQKMLAESPIPNAEEWAIHDYSHFYDICIGEYESIEYLVQIAEFISEHGELGAALLAEYSIEDAEMLLQDYYQGSYDSEFDFACSIFDECYADSIPKNLIAYIDYAAFERDLFISDYFSVEVNHKVHVFVHF